MSITFAETDYKGDTTAYAQALADTDFYKFTMGQVYDALLPHVHMEMKFHNRTADVDITKYAGALSDKLDFLCEQSIPKATLDRLYAVPYIGESYVEFLRLLRLNRQSITIGIKDGTLDVRSYGPARFSTFFETHVMSIVQEAYFNDVHANLDMTEGIKRLDEKVHAFKRLSEQFRFTFSEFGTRRRASFAWQHYVVGRFVSAFDHKFDCFLGTSNVALATKFGTPFVGTMAHEFLQVGQGLSDVALRNSQRHMLDLWHKFYRGRTGIALSDVVGNLAFLRDFDHMLAHTFIGVRHDSGDPFEWAERQIAHYINLGIDPTTKVLMFSDGLDFDLCQRLVLRFHGRIKLSFGIGTNFTNDLGVKPLQLVMKAVKINGNPVAKVSDSSGKGMCEDPAHETAVRAAYMIGEHFNEETHKRILTDLYKK